MVPTNPDSSEFAMSECAFECASCHAVNDSMTAEWCSCVSARSTLVCSACNRCFCEAPSLWRTQFVKSGAGSVYLQREQQRKGIKAVAATPAEVIRRPLILVIDDDRVVHLIADRVLAQFGGTVLHAEDGLRGLSMARQTRPDLVITDALLPKLDGRELALLLRSDPESHCRIVVMTALYKGRRYRDEAYKTFQVDEYLEKPISAPTLRRVAARHLGLAEELAS
jgi:CheY-like chemotaxis protein